MKAARAFAFALAIGAFAPAGSAADWEGPVFDAHLHYNVEAVEPYPIGTVMELFAKNEDRVLSRADILEEVWGMDAFPTDRTIDNFVLRLRRLFEANPEEPARLVTVRGRGYLFKKA